MAQGPVLASRVLPKGWRGNRSTMVFRVYGGMHYLRGNSSPYFSLTYWAHREGFPNQCDSGGAGHDEILKLYPQFADLAALHLADISGAPMHAVANGWYALAGAMGGMGQRHHAGNSERHFPCHPPADKPWQNTEYRKPTPAECLRQFADLWRIGLDEAGAIMAEVDAKAEGQCWMVDDAKSRAEVATAILTEKAEAMRPRWKAQATACIAKHGLQIYGDAWSGGGQ